MTNYSRLGTPSNLEFDGTYDMLVFEFPNGYPNGAINLAIGNNPRRITGVQKVAQAFTYCLFTTRGSDPIRPNFGTDFVTTAMSSNIAKDSTDITRSILSSISDAERQVKLLLNTNNRDRASQLESARLIVVGTEGDGITVSIRIITRAGEKAAVAVPFPQTNLEFN
jgi:hypothetical protein